MIFSTALLLLTWPIFWAISHHITAIYNQNPEAANAFENSYQSYATIFVVLSIVTVFLLLQLKRAWPLRKTKVLQAKSYMTLLACHMGMYYFVCWEFSQNKLGLWQPVMPW
jgi:drug/metabolite transporter (DMT)-like permease